MPSNFAASARKRRSSSSCGLFLSIHATALSYHWRASETPATVVLDGQHGFGQVMALRAMDWAVERAERVGVTAATLVNCSHTGRLGSYTERAARRGMAALMMVNTGG